ncbi:hypothetical protein TIFTF001_028962 [Ficus carica]|uniref:GPI-anchored protein LLG1-like domain-containing protein n=1 Tax=Ficus carica TaxID=3494 RepID=A0AA88DR00_FICCA|nr:hypothetical protein TIFTF001_028962 [Ficus carica]
MELDRSFFSMSSSLVFSLVLIGLISSASSSTFISDDILDSHGSTGRSLLQAKKGCPVNFEFLNYTIITSQCKGPHYPADRCCKAFKDFACPYADVLNDLTNDCSSTMFSYINLYGKYPPGLFASECREGKEGLSCPAVAPSQSLNENGTNVMGYPSTLLLLSAALIIFLFQFF